MDYVVLRCLCSFFCGMILSQTGSLLQMSTRNILASPSTLGFDGIAILWALVFHSISLVLFPEYASNFTSVLLGLPVFIFSGLILARLVSGKSKIERIILIGLTFNLLVGAIYSLWQFLFLAFNLPFPIELWFGNFRFATAGLVLILVLLEMLILIGFGFFKRDILLMTLGPGLSQNWNLDEKRLHRFLFVTIALGTFVTINLFGGFSFLGLIFPIIARKIWFPTQGLRGEFLTGSIVNGLALMGMDLLCYHFPVMGAEIPVGLIVTAAGAVSLIFLLWKSNAHGTIGKT
jgi:iron complex transport system permease protein